MHTIDFEPWFSQREVARKALVASLNALGDAWFSMFFDELRAGLQRGYQRHVLIASLHALLHGHEFAIGAIDETVEAANEILMGDLVGELGKEKKIGKIVGKTPEAKGTNYVIGCYKKMGAVVSASSFNHLLHPLKERLLNSIDQKEHLAIFGALQAMAEGILINDSFTPDHVLALVAAILTETASTIKPKEADFEQKAGDDRPGRKPESCFLLEPTKERGGPKLGLEIIESNRLC